MNIYPEALKVPLYYSQLQKSSSIIHDDICFFLMSKSLFKYSLMMLVNVNYVASRIEIWSWIDTGQIDSTG